MPSPVRPNEWLHRMPETEAVQAFHRQEAMRYAVLAAYSRSNSAIGETIALERLAEKHRLLALS